MPEFRLRRPFFKDCLTCNLRAVVMETDRSVPEESFQKALDLFKLSLPLDATTLQQRYQELLVTWHPHRYANMTNNPSKYMQMYKKGEAMTKEVRAAYNILLEWLAHQGKTSSSG